MFDLETHIGFTIVCVMAGAIFWLDDEGIAGRADLERQFEYDQFGLPDYDAERIGRDQLREKSRKTALFAGKVLMVCGLALALALAVRLAI